MLAFASNSLLCRAALKHQTVDAASFTVIRITSGAIALYFILQLRRTPIAKAGSWISALALFVYAGAFSFAYNTLSAGTGALLLFGAVQATMILWGCGAGKSCARCSSSGWRSRSAACSGSCSLVSQRLR